MNRILNNTWAVLAAKEKKRFVVLIGIDVIISVIDILSLALLLWIIQFYVQPAQSRPLPWLSGWLAGKDTFAFIAGFFVLFAGKNLAGYAAARAHYRFISRIAVRLSRDNLSAYQRGSFDDFVHIDSSALIRRISLQPFDFCQYMLSGIQQIITQLFLIMITVVAILLFNANLFLLLLAILLPPVILVFYLIKKRLTTAKKHIQLSNERSYQYLLDALKGYVEGNIYGRNAFFLDRFVKARRKFSTSLFDSLALQTLPSRIIEIFAVLGLFILIVIAKWSGNTTSALLNVGAFMAAAYKIIPGLVKIINIAGQMKAYEFATEHAAPSPSVTEESSLPSPIHTLGFSGVDFAYQGQPVLQNVSFELAAGDFAGIAGPSGIGKTTILNLLLGFLSPTSGQIRIDGRETSATNLKKYWPRIAYVRQQSFFIHDTLIRNITLEEESKNARDIDNVLHQSGLETLVNQNAEGVHQVISENGKNISGGQQQRIAIARALYKDASVILLDEPFNELDNASEKKLLEYFKSLSRDGKIVMMITHDTNSLSYCNKIISLDA